MTYFKKHLTFMFAKSSRTYVCWRCAEQVTAIVSSAYQSVTFKHGAFRDNSCQWWPLQSTELEPSSPVIALDLQNKNFHPTYKVF